VSPRPAVFLDRDGTLIEEVGYLDRLERLAFFPWSVDAVRLLNRAGFLVVVVTNQAGVARGMFDESFVREAHRHIDESLKAGDARVDAYYYCPHHPDGSVATYRQACDCRKPAPGMLRRAERELGADLSRSYVVGDRWLDVRMAGDVGARGILVRTGYGRTEEGRPPEHVRAAAVVENLIEAVSWILDQGPKDQGPRTRD
jgi:D-glycero-D-manno-heptose 1,7-bisphosphate phosphatase